MTHHYIFVMNQIKPVTINNVFIDIMRVCSRLSIDVPVRLARGVLPSFISSTFFPSVRARARVRVRLSQYFCCSSVLTS